MDRDRVRVWFIEDLAPLDTSAGTGNAGRIAGLQAFGIYDATFDFGSGSDVIVEFGLGETDDFVRITSHLKKPD